MNNKKHFNAKKKKNILCLSIKGFFIYFLYTIITHFVIYFAVKIQLMYCLYEKGC